jgi:hypothetical protein
MLWVSLTGIGIKPEKGLGTRKLHSASKVSALRLLQAACPVPFWVQGLPVSGSIQSAEKVWPGRALRKGFIGQYRFWVGQIHFHERQEFLDWGGWVPLSI